MPLCFYFKCSFYSYGYDDDNDDDALDRQVTNESVIAVQVFDQKKFKKKDQGFLGVINVQLGSVFDVDVGGDGTGFFFSFSDGMIYSAARFLTTNFRNAEPGLEKVKCKRSSSGQADPEHYNQRQCACSERYQQLGTRSALQSATAKYVTHICRHRKSGDFKQRAR